MDRSRSSSTRLSDFFVIGRGDILFPNITFPLLNPGSDRPSSLTHCGSDLSITGYCPDKRGRGVIPTPLPSFFLTGEVPPPMCRSNRGSSPSPLRIVNWGVPSPHQTRARSFTIFPKKPVGATSHAGDSTRNTGYGHAGKEPFAAKGGGGDPHPPPFFFLTGGVPPTHIPGQQGSPPSPAYHTVSRTREAITTGSGAGEIFFQEVKSLSKLPFIKKSLMPGYFDCRQTSARFHRSSQWLCSLRPEEKQPI